ncbi:MAG: PL29 family lyase N-terminal domain-containing protein [Bacteroidales bacterium]|nr:PL29 family lyase N-terminal domain-containing protein [Bacteroidales bacterium]MDD3201421.1 PL29 family lyase N-terminal domain-containing protein [Bacteroidales bacterium]
MKKIIFNITLLLSLSLILCGCHNEIENELGLLERRVAALETRCAQMNTNVESLQAIVSKLNKYDFITGVKTIYGATGIKGYTISFTNSPSITIYNGSNAETPTVGVKQGDDGKYYWIIRYASGEEVFITNNYGLKIEATAASPIVKIENGDWLVSYDGGEIWHNMGQATGTSGTSFIERIDDSTSFFRFVFLDGTSVNIPSWSTFETVQTAASTANTNYESLITLISNFDHFTYAQSFSPILSGQDTVGYRLYLSNGAVLPFYNGVATNMPVLSAKQDPDNPSDTAYYWTIKYADEEQEKWLEYIGVKVRADATNGTTPVIGVKKDSDNLYYWTISYDGGVTVSWLLTPSLSKILASAPENEALISSLVNVNNDYIQITIGSNTYNIPKYQNFGVTVDTSINMIASRVKNVSYSISNCSQPELLVIANDGFSAKITKATSTTGTIDITSPATFVAGQSGTVSFLISDGRGNLKNIIITINFGE